jgi:predicted TIM-barrel fold metal-dependent hydrolase
VREARELVASGVIRGLKLHPPIQQFSSSDAVAYPLYEIFAEARLPVICHTGHSGIGTGMPGGGEIRLKFGNPMPIDDVAVDFPSLPIIMAHPFLSLAGRSDFDLFAQAKRIHRPFGLVSQIFPGHAGAVCKHASQK